MQPTNTRLPPPMYIETRTRSSSIASSLFPLTYGIGRQIGANRRQREGRHLMPVDACACAFEHFDRLVAQRLLDAQQRSALGALRDDEAENVTKRLSSP